MRIIRGTHKGRRINPPKSFKARPTTDFAKEGLFNILGNRFDFEGFEVLELFAGSGSISYEFLSGGCAKAVAIEISKKHANFIQKTGDELFEGQLKVITGDAFNFIKKRPLNFDIIFADPPYELKEIDKLPELIFTNEKLKEDVTVIIEHSAETDYSAFKYFKREYGFYGYSRNHIIFSYSSCPCCHEL